MRTTIALLIAFCITGPACAATCQSEAQPTVQADQLAGVKTKWRFSRGNEARQSIEPDLEGLSPAQWMTALESEGVNLAELNVEPRELLSETSAAPDAEVKAYLKDYALSRKDRTPDQDAAVERFGQDVVAREDYTPAQRGEVLIDFLSKMQEAKEAGSIKGSVRFILHQRIWFRPGDKPRRVRMRERRIIAFATDMAEVINLAREKCLDHWIAGIRVGENGNPDMSSYLPVLPRLAKGVNDRTDGWLRKHFFLANGGGMGAEYAGISDVASSFFEQISKESGGFAFGYKLMQHRSRELRYIPDIMATSQCASNRQCDINSSGDWSYYIGQSLGFNELTATIRKYHASYPTVANVVFVGDSADAAVQLTDADPKLGIEDRPAFTALKGLWPHEAGWRGRVFMNGFISRSDIPPHEDGNPDSGIALFLSEDIANPMAGSIRIWKNWPD